MGNDWGIKKPVFKGFMNNYECSVLTLEKFGEYTTKKGLPGRDVRQPLSLQRIIYFFNVSEIDFV